MAKRQSTIFGGDVASDGSTSDSSDSESDASIDDSDDLTEEEDEEEEGEAEDDGDKEGQGNSKSTRRVQRERSTQHSRGRERTSDGLAGGSKAYPGAAAAGSSANPPETEQAVPANYYSPCDQDTTSAAARLPRCKCLVFAQHK